jgi:hypothetical protein
MKFLIFVMSLQNIWKKKLYTTPIHFTCAATHARTQTQKQANTDRGTDRERESRTSPICTETHTEMAQVHRRSAYRQNCARSFRRKWMQFPVCKAWSTVAFIAVTSGVQKGTGAGWGQSNVLFDSGRNWQRHSHSPPPPIPLKKKKDKHTNMEWRRHTSERFSNCKLV